MSECLQKFPKSSDTQCITSQRCLHLGEHLGIFLCMYHIRIILYREFPGGLVVRTPHFDCGGPRVRSLVREIRSRKPRVVAKKKKDYAIHAVLRPVVCLLLCFTQCKKLVEFFGGIKYGCFYGLVLIPFCVCLMIYLISQSPMDRDLGCLHIFTI